MYRCWIKSSLKSDAERNFLLQESFSLQLIYSLARVFLSASVVASAESMLTFLVGRFI